MQPPGYANIGVRNLFASWFAVTAWVVRGLVVRLKDKMESGADLVKDTIMDLGNDTEAEDVPSQPLPPLDPALLVSALRGEVEQVLRQVAETINEDPSGCWAAATQERVQALFSALGEESLAEALELRVAAAEAQVPSQRAARGQWAHKYRLMLAAEGRWSAQGEPAAR
jgi:hypothetical protein